MKPYLVAILVAAAAVAAAGKPLIGPACAKCHVAAKPWTITQVSVEKPAAVTDLVGDPGKTDACECENCDCDNCHCSRPGVQCDKNGCRPIRRIVEKLRPRPDAISDETDGKACDPCDCDNCPQGSVVVVKARQDSVGYHHTEQYRTVERTGPVRRVFRFFGRRRCR